MMITPEELERVARIIADALGVPFDDVPLDRVEQRLRDRRAIPGEPCEYNRGELLDAARAVLALPVSTASPEVEGVAGRLENWEHEPVVDEHEHDAFMRRAAVILRQLSRENERLKAERDEALRTVKRQRRQMDVTRRFSLRDMKEALAGDLRAIRNRVALMEAGPVEIVLSDARAALPQVQKEGEG